MRALLPLIVACSAPPPPSPAPAAPTPVAAVRKASGRTVAFCEQQLDPGETASIHCGDLQLGCPSIDLALFGDFDLEELTLPAICASDLAPLAKHARLRKLQIRVASNIDLAPLAKLPLEELELVSLVDAGTDELDLAPLAKLRTLRWAQVQSSKLRGVAAIATWSKLEALSLRGSGVGEPLPSLAPLRELASLDLLGTRGVTRISVGAKVKEIGLRKSDLRDLAGLESAASLETLDVSLTAVDDLRPLAALVKLRTLSLAATKVSDLRPLARLALVELDIAETPVADLAPIAGMRSLQTLDISYCPKVAIEHVEKLTWLRELDVRGNTVDCTEHRRLKAALTSTKLEPAALNDCPPR